MADESTIEAHVNLDKESLARYLAERYGYSWILLRNEDARDYWRRESQALIDFIKTEGNKGSLGY